MGDCKRILREKEEVCETAGETFMMLPVAATLHGTSSSRPATALPCPALPCLRGLFILDPSRTSSHLCETHCESRA
jgi:hypothetical protein